MICPRLGALSPLPHLLGDLSHIHTKAGQNEPGAMCSLTPGKRKGKVPWQAPGSSDRSLCLAAPPPRGGRWG